MRDRGRGPFSEKQQRALAAAFGRLCGRAQFLEDRVRSLELMLEEKGISTRVRRSFVEAAVAERQLECLVFPEQGSVREELAEILRW